MDVRPITTNDITRAAEVLADAFLDDPFTMWLFPEERRRERALRSWTKQLSVVYVPKGLASMTSGGEGVALWSSPSGWRLSAGQQVRLLLSYIGILGAHRLPKAAAGFSVIEKAHPAEPHWYLSAIGVDPLRQRAGAGSALIRPMLDRADAERTIVHLETFKARNVPYYQRFGFEVTAEDDIREGPHMWAMARRPLAGPT